MASVKVPVSTVLTSYALMDSSIWFDTINLGWSIVYIHLPSETCLATDAKLTADPGLESLILVPYFRGN